MSRAPDHDPADHRPPTNWSRLLLGLAGLALGFALVAVGVTSLAR